MQEESSKIQDELDEAELVEQIAPVILENVPEEKQAEFVELLKKAGEEKVQATTPEEIAEEESEDLEAKRIHALEAARILWQKQFHMPTPAHFTKKRGVGITRKNKSQSKKASKASKNSRRINRGK